MSITFWSDQWMRVGICGLLNWRPTLGMPTHMVYILFNMPYAFQCLYWAERQICYKYHWLDSEWEYYHECWSRQCRPYRENTKYYGFSVWVTQKKFKYSSASQYCTCMLCDVETMSWSSNYIMGMCWSSSPETSPAVSVLLSMLLWTEIYICYPCFSGNLKKKRHIIIMWILPAK